MRVNVLLLISTFTVLLAQAAPIAESNPNVPRKLKLGSGSKSSGGGLLGGLFGGKKSTAAAPPKTTPAATTPAAAKTTTPVASSATSVVATSSPAASSSAAASTSTPAATTTSSVSSSATSTSTTSSAAATESAGSCPLYVSSDVIDISERDLEKRAGEEYFFRFEDSGVVNAGSNILQLATRSSVKAFDDQAYKWISTDVSKVTRGKISGRLATVYVLPAGTRKSLQDAAQKFEVTSAAKKAVDFVTKDNEPGDIGINGVQASADGALPLDTFRNKVLRTVVKTVSAKAGGKATFTTITKGKKVNGASKADQKALEKFC